MHEAAAIVQSPLCLIQTEKACTISSELKANKKLQPRWADWSSRLLGLKNGWAVNAETREIHMTTIKCHCQFYLR